MNPTTGMFLSKDPVEGFMQRPMSRNGYSYVEGNPTNWTDPSGEFLPLIAAAIIGASLGALFGAAGAYMMHGLAQSGACGCRLKDWANHTNANSLALQSALVGGLIGGTIGLFPAYAGYIGAVVGGIGAGSTIYDMLSTGDVNLCNILQLILSVTGGLSGGAKVPFEFPVPTLGTVNLNGAMGYAWGVSTVTISAPIGAIGAGVVISPISGGTNFKGQPYKKSPNGKYKNVFVVGPDHKDLTEFDTIDTNQPGKFIEDKTGYQATDPDIWAEKQIYDTTKVQINALDNGIDTRPTLDGDPFPPLTDFKDSKTFLYDVSSSDPLLQFAVWEQIQRLKNEFPKYTFDFKR